MPVINKRRSVNLTFIQNIGDAFIWLNGKLVDKGDEVKDVFIIGTYLSQWLKDIGWRLGPIITLLNTWQYTLEDYLAYLLGIIDGISFSDLVTWYSGELVTIRYSLKNAMISRLLTIVNGGYDFLYNAPKWAYNMVVTHAPNLQTWLSNPSFIVWNIIYDAFGFLRIFFNDPYGYITSIIKVYLPFIETLKSNPTTWVMNLIFGYIPWFASFVAAPQLWLFNLLFGAYLWFTTFLNNPIKYIKDIISNYFGFDPSEELQPGIGILRVFFTWLDYYVSLNHFSVRNVAIVVLKRFM